MTIFVLVMKMAFHTDYSEMRSTLVVGILP